MEWMRCVMRGGIWFSLAIAGWNMRAQHVHLSAGAYSPVQNEPLVFVEGSLYDTNSYSGVYPACIFLVKDDPNVPLYPGLYQNDVSFTARPATTFTGGPALYAAELGTYVEMIVRSVQGPADGVLGVWQEDDEFSPTYATQLFSVPVGTLNGTHRMNLTQSPDDGGWEGDPYGHIHGRRFTLNKPGLYVVGLQLIDASATGAGGGPHHSPSLTNYFYFQAGLTMQLLKKTNNTAHIRFGLRGFKDYYLEANNDLNTTNWQSIVYERGATHSDLHTLVDTNATNAARFYRVREVPIEF